MANLRYNRTKRVSIYINKEVTDKLIIWLNEQENLGSSIINVLEKEVSGEYVNAAEMQKQLSTYKTLLERKTQDYNKLLSEMESLRRSELDRLKMNTMVAPIINEQDNIPTVFDDIKLVDSMPEKVVDNVIPEETMNYSNLKTIEVDTGEDEGEREQSIEDRTYDEIKEEKQDRNMGGRILPPKLSREQNK